MRQGDWMQTVSGQKFWPIDPKPEEIHLEDIAHALSMMCRFNGHCKWFYSVAEHSVYVCDLLEPKHKKWGLLHDASEAYIADIVRPAKRFIDGYKPLEYKIMAAVRKRFDLDPIEPWQVKDADNAILADEADQVMGKRPDDWKLPCLPSGTVIMGLTPSKAKQLFLDRAVEIGLV